MKGRVAFHIKVIVCNIITGLGMVGTAAKGAALSSAAYLGSYDLTELP